MSSHPPSVAIKERNDCVICGSSNCRSIEQFPEYPLTGIFVNPEDQGHHKRFDQELIICETCGHGQLRHSIDPEYLYQDTYTHRTSESSISTSGNDFFFSFIKEIIMDRKFDGLVEIGCNDLYLLKKFEDIASQRWGIDPVWGNKMNSEVDGIIVNGSFLEELNPSQDIPFRPDIVISSSTLEHVEEPMIGLQDIYEHAADECVFFVEVPSFDTLLLTLRKDQIFHQHLNYYSLSSFIQLIDRLGGTYLHHTHNYNYWHGNLLIAFEKRKKSEKTKIATPLSMEYVFEQLRLSEQMFGGCLKTLHNLNSLNRKIFGYGAAQMLPVYAYHLKSDLEFLECVFDDDLEKNGKMYPDLPVVIRSPEGFSDYQQGSFLITALDSYRPIAKHLMSVNARDILYPFGIQ